MLMMTPRSMASLSRDFYLSSTPSSLYRRLLENGQVTQWSESPAPHDEMRRIAELACSRPRTFSGEAIAYGLTVAATLNGSPEATAITSVILNSGKFPWAKELANIVQANRVSLNTSAITVPNKIKLGYDIPMTTHFEVHDGDIKL